MKIISTFFLLSFLFFSSAYTQDLSDPRADKLYQNYYQFEEKSIQDRRFKQKDILPLVQDLNSHPDFRVRQVGSSIEGRPLQLISIGEGETDILFWSQMHGNEPTATAAIFDVFNFLADPGEDFSEFRDNILKDATLHFLPMLNPDGAEQFERRNAVDIDVNRDALRLTSPESVALKTVRDSLNPRFGFNLHDQSTFYTSGRSEHPATVSFLAPAYDFEQSENKVRRDAMKLIVSLNEMLQTFIPNQIAKYSDAHEPRAFGDMIQKWGTSTILIESGGYKDDTEKQFIRKLNFVMLLVSADAIGREEFTTNSIDDYYEIPENNLSMHDLIIREVEIEKNNDWFKVDLGIRHNETDREDHRSFTFRGRIGDIGDLSTNQGYREINAKGMKATPGKVFKDTVESVEKLQEMNTSNLLNQGYTDVVVDVEDISGRREKIIDDFPLNIVLQNDHENDISLGSTPNLILTEDNEVKYTIVNGFVYDVEKDNIESIKDALIIR